MVVSGTVRVLLNEPIGPSVYRIRVEAPEIGPSIRPGQFVMIRPHGGRDPLLGRPLALYDTADVPLGPRSAIDLVYLVHGAGTVALSGHREGDLVDVWGPLGNCFPRAGTGIDTSHVLILAGGIGQTPFVAVIQELLGTRTYGLPATMPTRTAERITFCWGARTSSALAGLEDFRQPGVEIQVSTDDGTAGLHGNVVQLAETVVDESPRPTCIFACGPERMLEAVSEFAVRSRIPTWVSLETKMACGYGVCFSCVCAVRDATSELGWDYRRVCLEGSVFPSDSIVWRV